jgi:hypothetical protein
VAAYSVRFYFSEKQEMQSPGCTPKLHVLRGAYELTVNTSVLSLTNRAAVNERKKILMRC